MNDTSNPSRQIDVFRQDRSLSGLPPLYFISLSYDNISSAEGLWITQKEAITLILKLNNMLLAEV